MSAPVHQKLGQSVPVLDVDHTLGRCEVARLHGFLQSLLDGLTRPHVELGEGREEGRGDGGRGRGGGSLITLHTNYCTCINFVYMYMYMYVLYMYNVRTVWISYFRGLCDSRWSFVLPATRL